MLSLLKGRVARWFASHDGSWQRRRWRYLTADLRRRVMGVHSSRLAAACGKNAWPEGYENAWEGWAE